MEALARATPDELRARIPEVFAAIDAADDATAPLVAGLAARAFAGPAGLAALREEATLPFILHGLRHADARVRALTAEQLQRLCGAADVALLSRRGVLPLLAAAVGGDALGVAEKAAGYFGAAARAGADALGAALDDGAALGALRALAGGADATRALRALALFADAAGAGDGQLALCEARGLLAPILAVWRGDDALVRLNAVELFGPIGRGAAGFRWLASSGALGELGALLDSPVGDEPMDDLLRPAALAALGAMLDGGEPEAHRVLLSGERSLVLRLWPLLSAADAEQHRAALATLRSAAGSRAGLAATLGAPSLAPLAAFLRSPEEEGRIGALAVLAQLLRTAAADGAGGAPPAPRTPAAAAAAAVAAVAIGGGGADGSAAAMDAEATGGTGALEPALRALVGACSPTPSTSAADALALAGASLSAALRVAAFEVLGALAELEWGAAELAASEGVLELLLTTTHIAPPSAAELRLKHAVAAAMLRWPNTAAQLGGGAAAALAKYAAEGPFAVQKPREAAVRAPQTL